MPSKTTSRQSQNRCDHEYEILYTDLLKASNADLAEWKKYFGHYTKDIDDFFFIGLTVCNDILCQRGIDIQTEN